MRTRNSRRTRPEGQAARPQWATSRGADLEEAHRPPELAQEEHGVAQCQAVAGLRRGAEAVRLAHDVLDHGDRVHGVEVVVHRLDVARAEPRERLRFNLTASAQVNQAQNPIIFADVPDMSMIRVGDTYYMSSTTMHMSPGVPIMKSKDLVNWQIVNYAYDTLGDIDALTLKNGKNAYGRGSWASCIRYHNSTFYVSTFSSDNRKDIYLFNKGY